MSLSDLPVPGPLADIAKLNQLGQEIVQKGLTFALAEREMQEADRVGGEIRGRVPPGVMPPPSVRAELEAALAIARKAFDRVKRAEHDYKQAARALADEMRKASER